MTQKNSESKKESESQSLSADAKKRVPTKAAATAPFSKYHVGSSWLFSLSLFHHPFL